MTALLTDNLPLLAAAPNGIKKLRELILELAVRGKLVPQDPSDEPASELLKRIAEEKARLVVDGSTKKQKQLPGITQDETPFDVPAGWCWVRMGAVGETNIGLTYSPSDVGGIGIPVLRSSNVQKGQIDLSDLVRVDMLVKDSALVQEGDLLICARNGSKALVGKTAMISNLTEPMAFGAFMAIFRSQLNPYLLRFINSPLFRKVIDDVNTTTINQITQNNLRTTLLPLPPLAEQHRIVAKVDELMALCDRLEAQQAGAESAHAQLVKALLDSLTQANDATEFATNWQRLAEHFHTLFTTEPSIDALKQTVLQLAVMGKLGPQHTSDEPASELLARIAEEKSHLVAEGKIRKQKSLAEIMDEEKPYELPTSWQWCRLGSQVVESGAGWSPSCEPRPREGAEWGVLKVSAVSWGAYKPEENKALPASLEARTEHEVRDGDFLISRANTAELVARSVVVETTPHNLMLSDKIVRLKLTLLCARRYVNLANSTLWARDYYSQVAGGTSSSMKNVSRDQILNLPIALPPLAEQHRIVAKVDQLMHQCETLMQKIIATNAKQSELLNALIEQV